FPAGKMRPFRGGNVHNAVSVWLAHWAVNACPRTFLRSRWLLSALSVIAAWLSCLAQSLPPLLLPVACSGNPFSPLPWRCTNVLPLSTGRRKPPLPPPSAGIVRRCPRRDRLFIPLRLPLG